jgi:hypothetical protein
MKRVAGFCVGLLAVLVAGGCFGSEGSGGSGGAGSASVPLSQIAKAVLQPADLQPVFSQFDGGKIVGSDLQPGPRGSLERFERRGGWKARYRRSGSSATRGPLVVQSLVDAFPDADRAKDDLDAYGEEFEAAVAKSQGSAERLELPGLGDQAVGLARLQVGSPSTRYYTIAWRYGNVTASVSVDGFEGKLTLAQVLALARKQETRLVALAGP